LRNKKGTETALKIPAIYEWYNSLSLDNKRRAESLLGKINELTIDSEDDRRSLLKHAILAFENLRIKENLNALDRLKSTDLDGFISVFENVDDIEATLYYQIVKTRIEVINALQNKVENNALEKIIQQHLYDHLWLLDPGWERACATDYMEQTIEREFGKITADLSDEEKRGRIDIKYRKTSGKHIIIELKRAERTVTSYELMEQTDKYQNALRKILESISGREHEPIEVVCVVGRPLSNWENNPGSKQQDIAAMEKKNIRIVLYQELIENAEKSYQAYLNKKKEVGRILDLIQKIDSKEGEVDNNIPALPAVSNETKTP